MKPIPPTVLHVDDEANDLFLFEKACRSASVTLDLRSVLDGQKAIDYLSGVGPYADRDQHPLPVLVLLDVKMPRKNGFEVLAWLRTQPKLKRLPVLILTSSPHEEDINRAYECGANAYLLKPVQLNQLVDLVKRISSFWLELNKRPQVS
jgi:CheY-like chemotaxis protein